MPPNAYPNQSIFSGAHHFHMRDVVNALDATQVNVVNKAGMQQSERERLDALPIPAGGSSERNPIFRGVHQFQMRDFVNAPNATRVHVVNEGARLEALPKHSDMSAKRAEYLPDSRKLEVEELSKRESSETDLVLCIHGPAGIGKSTLAGHLSDKFRSEDRLAASIFLGAFPTDTSGPETIIQMIAREIGTIHPQAIPKIVDAMDQCHGTPLENHLQRYIVEPLRSLNHPQALIIIIDTMDEWRDHPTFIKALAHLNSESRVVKFIITDRLNPCASNLPGIENVSIHTYPLGPLSREVINAYFHKYLKTVPWVDGRQATPADVEKLTDLSGGLPAWAATVIALLSYRFSESPPHQILEGIVGSRHQVGGRDGLGELYLNALSRLFPSPEARRQFRRYLGAIIALQEPLSLSDFSMLTGIPLHLINHIRFSLSAVQTRSLPPDSEEMIHSATSLFHMSFIEYVQAATTESSFSISTFDSHSTLGLACLKQVACLPPSSSASHLRDHQCYAVKHWPFHVSKGTPRPNDQWSRTEHCLTLQKLTAETRRQWATMFLKTLMPGEMESIMDDIGPEDGMVSILSDVIDSLDKSGEDRWGFQVVCWEVAVRIDDDNARAWTCLGECYDARGDEMGSLQMYEEAVVAFRHALRLRTDPHPDRAESLNRVANALALCYEQNGDMDVLSEAISCHQEAVALLPAPHPDRSMSLNNLAKALQSLYKCNGGIRTLNEVISLHREALELRPAPHPDRSMSLNNLANAL